MKGPRVEQLHNYACHHLRLQSYLRHPGDGRSRPQIPAQALVGALLIGQVLRVFSFCRLEWLIHSPARGGLGVPTAFCDDTRADFTGQLDPEITRPALADTLKHAKRNKAFENTGRIGLAGAGAGAGYTHKEPCALCHPVKDKEDHTCGRLHHL